jgi:hypothetical protein
VAGVRREFDIAKQRDEPSDDQLLRPHFSGNVLTITL